MARLEELTVDSTVIGLAPNQPVTIVAAKAISQAVYEVTYKDPAGHLFSELVYREDEHRLSIVSETRAYSLTAPGDLFRLVSEANRIRLAYLFDPVLAVHISDIEPLPHQITAVYEEMLPRQPLRFLLADDPGAGKTIMAGLLIKELIARGDLKRCLIVCPGGLVDQWQDELWRKFHIHFQIVTRSTIEESATGNPFAEKNLVIARLDHLSRNEEVQARLEQTDWDLIICDEAHKMAASYTGDEIKYTKRYQLGQRLSGLARHFLLMSATPHNGKEADFQLFLALLDGDRFEGKFRDGVHQVDVSDLMRRLVKEKLLKFDGTPLFPERRAYTTAYALSDLEARLYAEVTSYVREEMNRADDLEGNRGNLVGFALTSLQRRLASSPEAIYQSLRRRKERLERRLAETRTVARGVEVAIDLNPTVTGSFQSDDEDEYTAAEIEELESNVVDFASASRTIRELELEIATLARLERLANQVRESGTDSKWEQLSSLLQDNSEMFDGTGHRRKLIVFTEQRDTLNYLKRKITNLLGREEEVVEIHGQIGREDRRKVQEEFRNNKDVLILLATDAAGEGVNLQRAHLMVNYDLPWNPNRLEQRFGRIHRIGQREVCHCWNLVAEDTREGDVYLTLLRKLEVERQALGGQVFDVLGQLFTESPLRQMLVEAIRYGDQPSVRATLKQKVDGALDHGKLVELLEKNALVKDAMDTSMVMRIRDDMERAEALRLQPHFIQSFFLEAFRHLGGTCYQREPGRFEITNVPAVIRERDRQIGLGEPISRKYERITFDKRLIAQDARVNAAFVCPGHPLLDATIDIILERYRGLMTEGTVLVDETGDTTEPRLVVSLEHAVRDGRTDSHGLRRVISRRMQYVAIGQDGSIANGGPAPYLDVVPPRGEHGPKIAQLLDQDWIRTTRFAELATGYASQFLGKEHREAVSARKEELVGKTRAAVHERLTKEINYWDHRATELRRQEEAGRARSFNSTLARQRAEELALRLRQRMAELDDELQISAGAPAITGAALVIPAALLGEAPPHAPVDRDRLEQLAVEAVVAREMALGHEPVVMPPGNPGYDIESKGSDGHLRFIEVKGKGQGVDTVTISKQQILTALNKPESFILAIGIVDDDEQVDLRYIRRPFDHEPDFATASVNFALKHLLAKVTAPA